MKIVRALSKYTKLFLFIIDIIMIALEYLGTQLFIKEEINIKEGI